MVMDPSVAKTVNVIPTIVVESGHSRGAENAAKTVTVLPLSSASMR